MSHPPILCGVLLLAVRAEIGRAIAFRRAFDRVTIPFAGFAFALVNAKNAFDALKPPLRIAEIRGRIQAELKRAAQYGNNRLIQSAGLVRL